MTRVKFGGASVWKTYGLCGSWSDDMRKQHILIEGVSGAEVCHRRKAVTMGLSDHPDSSRILEALGRCLPLEPEFSGRVFRSSDAVYSDDANVVSGEGSFRYGGRWTPKGAFACVYTSLDPSTVRQEFVES
jgi:hypothetical protein